MKKKFGQKENGSAKRRRGHNLFPVRILVCLTADMAQDIENALEAKQTRLDYIRGAIADRLAKR